MNEFVVKDDNKLTVGIGWDAKKVDLKKKIKIAIDSIMSANTLSTSARHCLWRLPLYM